MPVTSPKYQINDVVYIVASAAGRGFLESYKIDGISFNKKSNTWLYQIDLTKPPVQGVTVGNREMLVHPRILYFNEAELTDYCTALNMCKSHLESALSKINSLMQGCGGTE